MSGYVCTQKEWSYAEGNEHFHPNLTTSIASDVIRLGCKVRKKQLPQRCPVNKYEKRQWGEKSSIWKTERKGKNKFKRKNGFKSMSIKTK